ncbi:MAG TPA: transglutaminase domain-containing protein [Candidatus Eisenbergiella merdipullorum]|uniref:Transglutaminase domain-containing protein n=1 Tax=Candidatus Eisenbergiella merdipullorum TaxID=2838553 RepID=A0A9D2L116_9FIRM|nr:transglutaminase domain-containing protein [Candidatus Eisenbergiella merdipullorum]
MFSDAFIHYAQNAFENRLPLLGETGTAVRQRLSDCPEGVRELLQFFYGFMPLSDAFTYEFDLFFRYAAQAASLRREVERCALLPEEIFLHDVAWYRINSEKIVDCRSFFQEQVFPLIRGLDETQAVLAVNYWCASQASYEASDDRTQSPLSVYRSGSGRCGEESTFFVTVLRSVGIPARQVYVPRWAHCDDNHAWVEVYVDGKWHYLGACEPEEVLDRGWFTNAASRALLVYARTFTDFGVEKEVIGRNGCVRFLNVTEHYARTKEVCIHVTDMEGRNVPGASVSLQILNMAEFCSVITLTAGQDGTARLSLGYGDILVRAWKDSLCAQALLGAQEEEICLKLEERLEAEAKEGWEDMEIHAPEDGAVSQAVPDAAQKALGRARLKEADAARERKLAAFRAEADKAALEYPQESDIFRRARGNVELLKEFLDGEDWKRERREILHSLSDKDFRDLDTQIAEEQLCCVAPLQDKLRLRGGRKGRAEWGCAGQSGRERDIFVRYCLCPRIGREELTAFGKTVGAFFSEQEKAGFADRPEKIWEWEQDHLRYVPREDYDTLVIPPEAALRGLWADEMGKRTLFAAVCRTLGIPARLDPVTGQAEYLDGDVWIEVSGGSCRDGALAEQECSGSARLILLTRQEDQWSYSQTWTIGRLEGERYVTLHYEGIRPENGRIELPLRGGSYRLIVTNRMPNGNQYVSTACFRLKDGEEKVLEPKLRLPRVEDMMMKNPLPPFSLTDCAGKTMESASLLTGTKSLLIFVEEGKEPTEHVLNELLAEKEKLGRLSYRLLFVADSPGSLENPLLKHTAGAFETAEVYFDERLENAEPVARRMYVAPDLLPLLVAVDEQGCGIYACSGYHVGSVGLALKLLEMPFCPFPPAKRTP